MKNLRRFHRAAVASGLLALSALAAAPAYAVTYTEVGDAGQTPAAAQSTVGAAGTLSNIFGALGATNDADLFVIDITSPASFSARTLAVSGIELDTTLFLFSLSGAAVYANDDQASGLSLLSLLPSGNALGPVTPGLYLLGVALSGVEPVNLLNQLLFATGLPTDIRGPAAGLSPATLTGFDGDGFAPAGAYNIELTGASVAVIPEPGTAAMFLLAGAAAAARRLARRRQTRPANQPALG